MWPHEKVCALRVLRISSLKHQGHIYEAQWPLAPFSLLCCDNLLIMRYSLLAAFISLLLRSFLATHYTPAILNSHVVCIFKTLIAHLDF